MARILYGVAGEGFGHSSRAHLIGQRLIEAGHDVMFAASNKSLQYLEQYFPGRVKEISGLSFVFNDRGVSFGRTFFHNVGQLPKMVKLNGHAFLKDLRKFDADLVITDFEPYSAMWAKIHSVPCISVDHEHLLSKADYINPATSKIVSYLSKTITNNYLVDADAYVILNFFNTPVNDPRAVVAAPVVRQQVMDAKPAAGDHIVCYATCRESMSKFLKVFRHFRDQKFIVYGAEESRTVGNCQLKRRSTEGFLSDLASCRGVIATSGFSLLSECLYLRKKMLVIPIQNQYEQMINAVHVGELGLGVAADKLSCEVLDEYLEFVEKPSVDSPDVLRPDNEQFFGTLDAVMKKVTNNRIGLNGCFERAKGLVAVA